MFRDFTESGKETIKAYMDRVTSESNVWCRLTDAIEKAQNSSDTQKWLANIGASRRIVSAETYKNSITERHDTAEDRLDEIFDEVRQIDGRYGEGSSEEVSIAGSVLRLIQDLAAVIDPNGGNLNIAVSRQLLADDAQKIQDARQAKKNSVKGQMLGVDPKAASVSVDPVNLSTGNFIYDHEDLRIGGEIPLMFHRYYNSQDASVTSMGKGFRHNYDIKLDTEKENPVLTLHDGQRHELSLDENGDYTGRTLPSGVVRKTAEYYEYRSAEDLLYRFDRKKGNLVRIEDLNGRGADLSYENGQLTGVVTDNGDFLVFSYDENGMLSEVKDSSGRTVNLYYGNGNLIKAELSTGTSVVYSYNAGRRITEIINPAGVSAIRNEYDDEFRVTKQYFPDGGTEVFLYDGKLVTQTERNGSIKGFLHDDRLRNTEIRYHDGTKETFVYNDRNQCIKKTSRTGKVTRFAYDSRGNLTQVIDAEKHRTNMTYDAENRLLKVSVNGKERVWNAYDRKGNLVKEGEAGGKTAEYRYDEKGRLLESRDSGGYSVKNFYDEKGNLIKSEDSLGAVRLFVYDRLNRMVKETDPNGNVTEYGYDEADHLITETNAAGDTRKYVYNKSGKITETEDYDGTKENREYNVTGHVSAVTDKDGNRTEFTYDLMWNVASVTAPDGSRRENRFNRDNLLSETVMPDSGVYRYEYDAEGNLTGETDPEGNRTEAEYDGNGQIISITNAEGTVTRFAYDEDGNLTEVIDAMGHTVRMTYDGRGNRTSLIDEAGYERRFAYDADSHVTEVSYPDGSSEKFGYSMTGRLVSYTNRTGGTESYAYDLNGNLIRRTDVFGNDVTMTYDCLDRMTSVMFPDGGTAYYAYDKVGNITGYTDEKGNTTKYFRTKSGALSRVITPDGAETVYEHDCFGNVSGVIRGSGEVAQRTEIERNYAGQIVKVKDPLGEVEEFLYDKCGKLIEKISKDGQKTVITYTPAGQVKEVAYGNGQKASFAYNILSQLTEVNDWTGRTQITVDALGRAVSVADAEGNTTGYEYNSMNGRTRLIYPDGTEVRYSYNERGEMTSLNYGNRTAQYRYDAEGRCVERTYDDGVSTLYAYNSIGRVESIRNTNGKGIVDEYRYTYDLNGAKTGARVERGTLAGKNGDYRFTYDTMGRLSSVAKDGTPLREYRYDIFGNRVEKKDLAAGEATVYVYNAAGQLTGEQNGSLEKTYAYDRNGNLSAVTGTDGENMSYAYDPLGRITRAVKTGRGTRHESRYTVNVFGHRTGRTSTGSAGTVTEKYTVDLTRRFQNILMQEGTAGTAKYLYDGKVSAMDKGGEVFRYLSDDHGSPEALLNDAGIFVNSYAYDEFGIQEVENEQVMQPVGYVGFLREADGSYYAQARQYHPQTGRFNGEDRHRGYLDHPLTLNRYTYCLNDPEDYEDDDGQMPTVLIGALVGFAVGGLVELGSQVISGCIEGKSFTESLTSVNIGKIFLEAGKGAAKGFIAGTGIGAVALAGANAAVDAAGSIAEDLCIDHQKFGTEVIVDAAVTGVVSFATSMVAQKVVEPIKKKLTGSKSLAEFIQKKTGLNTKLIDSNKGNQTTVDWNNRQLKYYEEKLRDAKLLGNIKKINRFTGKVADKVGRLRSTVLSYAATELLNKTTNKVVNSTKSAIQKGLFGKSFKGWTVYGMSHLAYCELGL